MANLNYIMPQDLKDGFCDREEKQNKVKHNWLPSGQTRSCPTDMWVLNATVSIVDRESGAQLPKQNTL